MNEQRILVIYAILASGQTTGPVRISISIYLSTEQHLNVENGSKPIVYNTFDLDMCFAPQRRALFPHLDNIWTSINGPNMW